MSANEWNRGRNGVSKRAVNAACRAIGREQGGTEMGYDCEAEVAAGRGDPARENVITRELFPSEWQTQNKPFGPEDNVTWEAPADQFPVW